MPNFIGNLQILRIPIPPYRYLHMFYSIFFVIYKYLR